MSDPEPGSSNAHTFQMGKLRHTEKAGGDGEGSEAEDCRSTCPSQKHKRHPFPHLAPDPGARRGEDPGPATPRAGAAGPSSHRPGVRLFVGLARSLPVFLCFSFGLFIFCLCFCHCCRRPVSVSPRVSPSLLVSMPFSGPPRGGTPTPQHRGGGARRPAWGAALAPRASGEAGGGGRPPLGPGRARAASPPCWPRRAERGPWRRVGRWRAGRRLREGDARAASPKRRDLPPLNRFSFAQRPELKASRPAPNDPEVLRRLSRPLLRPAAETRPRASRRSRGCADRVGQCGHGGALGGRSQGTRPATPGHYHQYPELPGPALAPPLPQALLF